MLHDWMFGIPTFGILSFAPDTGGGVGGGEDDLDDATNQNAQKAGQDEKVYTEAELKERIKQAQIRWRKGLQKKAGERDEFETRAEKAEQALKEAKDRIEELEVQCQKFREDKNPDAAAEMEIQRKKHERDRQEWERQLADKDKKIAAAEQKAKEVRREHLLQAALSEAGCTDLIGGMRYFSPIIEWNEDFNDWGMTTADGTPCSIELGVKDQLPDYLRPASQQRGGSGIMTGSPKKTALTKELDREEKKLAELKLEAERTRSTTAILQYEKQRKLVAVKQRELAKM